MMLLSSIDELASLHSCAFVPTMGALHAGHLALVHRAAAFRMPVLVSIFVNPTQFAPTEDLSKYPRTLERDLELLRSTPCAAVFTPSPDVIYPPGHHIHVPTLPVVATLPQLEDAHRPTHFAGVCQVVARLFDLVQPSIAIFGEKDYQQLRVISDMVVHENSMPHAAPRWPGLQIISHPTVREPDGLAMSSRNMFLTADQHSKALGLSRALHTARSLETPAAAQPAMRAVLLEHGLAVDYAVVRDSCTLLPISNYARPARALIAARLPNVRLIDNAAIP